MPASRSIGSCVGPLLWRWIGGLTLTLSLIACSASETRTPTPADIRQSPSATPRLTSTPSLTPTPTPTRTATPTPGPGLSELLGTPDALAQAIEFDAALVEYEKLAKLYPHRAEPRLRQAAVALQLGDVAAALDYLRLAVKVEPTSFEAWRQYALLLDQQGMYAELVEAYTGMLELRPVDLDLLIARASAYARLGQTDEAIADLSAAQSADPTRQYAWLNVAAAASSNRQYGLAIEIASAGLDLNPDFAGLWLERGLAHLSLNQPASALEDFTRAIDFDDQHYVAYRWRGWTLAEMGRRDEGLEDLQQAIDLGERAGIVGLTEAYDAMADAADVLARDDPQAAFNFMARYVFEYGSRDPLIVGYARIDWRRGNLELALSRLRPLVEDGYVPALFWRGQIFADDGQIDAAITDLEAFLDARTFGPQAEVARRLLESLNDDSNE